MPINADKPLLWKDDIRASVDQFTQWFMVFAPKAFREARLKTTEDVEKSLRLTKDLTAIDAVTIAEIPQILPTLRMSTCPPLARDRLVGLAYTSKNLVYKLEEGAVPRKLAQATLQEHLGRVSDIISKMLDRDIFPWLASKNEPTEAERDRASTIVGDRLCGAVVKDSAQRALRKRQYSLIARLLDSLGYHEAKHLNGGAFTTNDPGTYTFDIAVPLAMGHDAMLPIDVVVQPRDREFAPMPLLFDVQLSHGTRDAARNCRRAIRKRRSLRMTYAASVPYTLMLGGEYDAGCLGTLAAEQVDWFWQHRLTDLASLVKRSGRTD